MINYDIIIVGGGIAGLFCALNLSSKRKVLLIEKNSHLGGRIETFDEKVNGSRITYEIGAGRIASSHTRTMKLIKHYGLNDKLVENINKKIHILGSQEYCDVMTDKNSYKKLYKIRKDEKFNIQFLLDKVIKSSNKYKKDELINMSLFNLIQLELSSDASQFLLDGYGYISELIDINAFDGIYSLKSGFGKHNKYYSMIGGLKQLIEKITNELQDNNVDILTKKNFKEYSYNSKTNIFTVKLGGFLNEQIYNCRRLILAVPRNSLRKIDGLHNSAKLMRNIYSVKPHPLCRIYAVFPKNNDNKVWFYNLNKITTDNVIQYIIPINKESGLIMISYSDNLYADYWNAVRRQNSVKKILMLNLRRLFPTFNIPEPSFINIHYWKEGCHYYNVGVNSQKVRDEILKPFPKKELYICGEAYSKDQAWIEGALETAENVVSNINKTFRGGNYSVDLENLTEYSLEEVSKHKTKEDAWIVIDGLVLDITKWIPIHPGGDIILKGLGRDFTRQWWNIKRHNAEIRDKYFPKLIIGKIKN